MSKVTVIPSKINPITHLPNAGLMRKRVAAYARVSTLQEEQNSSYEAQVDYYTRFIKSKPEWEFVDIYTDEGISGTNTKKRDGFNKMISDALSGKIDLIITKSVSRFARNTVDSLTTIRKLKDAGIEVFFEKENIYTLDSKGELLIAIISSIAQEESRSISENVKWGKRKKLADGQVSMAYSRFLGYDKKNGEVVVNEEEARVIRLIYKEFLKGETYRAIKAKLESEGYKTPTGKEEWNVSTIKSILINEKYKGDALLQKTYVKDFLEHKPVKNNGEIPQYYVENHHEPIIDPKDFELVQEEIKRRGAFKHSYSTKTLFASKLVCADCGAFYGQKIWHSKDKYRKHIYRCNDKFNKSHHKCLTPTLTEEEIKKAFIKAYNELMKDKSKLIEDTKEMTKVLDNQKELEDKIKKVKEEMDEVVNLVKKLIDENSRRTMNQEDFITRYKDYDKKHNELKERLAKKEEELNARINQKKKLELFLLDLESKKEVISEFDKDLFLYFASKMVVDRNSQITFYFKNDVKITIQIE